MQGTSGADVAWLSVWGQVGNGLGRHFAAGRGHLTTEDTLRLCLIEALGEHGVDPGRLAAEVYAPNLGAGKLDLTVDGPAGTVIELKYPRDSRTGFSPDTMTLGELLRDFCRVAVVDADDRWVVQVINDRLARYLDGAAARFGMDWAIAPGETMRLERPKLQQLPVTALTAIGTTPWRLPVHATCTNRERVADELALFAYRVSAPGADVAPAPLEPAPVHQTRVPAAGSAPMGRLARADSAPRGARREILDAMDQLAVLSGSDIVAINEIVDYLRRHGTRYAESTIRTMVSSHLCAESQGPGIDPWEDLERVGRGLYRRRPVQPH